MDDINLDNNVPEAIRDVFNPEMAKANKTGVDGENLDTAKANKDSLAGRESVDASVVVDNQGVKTMENEVEITKAVRAEVAKIFEEKDAQSQAKAVEQKITALEGEKADLTSSVATLTAEKEKLEAEKQALATEKDELCTKNSALETELAEAKRQAEEAKAELAKIHKDQTTAQRKEELSNAGVLIQDETLCEKQIAKIAEMSDEQFTEYVEELKAIAKCGTTTKKKGVGEEEPEEEKKDEEAKKAEEEKKAKAEASKKALTSAGGIFQKTMAYAQSGVETDSSMVKKYASI